MKSQSLDQCLPDSLNLVFWSQDQNSANYCTVSIRDIYLRKWPSSKKSSVVVFGYSAKLSYNAVAVNKEKRRKKLYHDLRDFLKSKA